jgi:putative endonuclease
MSSFWKWFGFGKAVEAGRPEVGETGARGERAAERFLRREKGFRIVARNWRSGRDELDLVCSDGTKLVFVEVKTRAAGALVPGYYTVDRRKKRALKRACYAYMKRLRQKPPTFRFDVVEIMIHIDGGEEVLHFENIPLFPKGYQG